jgi:hypothetical protein
MPSITYWNRLEPSSRTNDLLPRLAAPIHDALWFLTRQWQFGEFRAVDSGSAAWIEVDTTAYHLTQWSPIPGSVLPLDPLPPLETLLAERRTLDIVTGVEIGQMFETILANHGLTSRIGQFRQAFPISEATIEECLGDVELLRFRALVAGRGIEGTALYRQASVVLPAGEPSLRTIALDDPQLVAALQELIAAVDDLLDVAVPPEPRAWRPERFDYELDLIVGGVIPRLTCKPGDAAEITWETLETSKTPNNIGGPADHEVTTLLPANVRFRGISSSRWWDFDSATIDFGAVDVERRDLARLLVNDFLIRQGNDWFVIPLEQDVGSQLRIDNVIVRDVFGFLTLVPAEADNSLFTIDGPAAAYGRLLLPSAASFIQYGEAIEEVRFVRDPMLNVVWAVEEKVEGPVAHTPSPAPSPNSLPAYRLRTDVPQPWTPFIPVAREAGRVLVERVAFVEPAGRIIRPPLPPDTAYRFAEDELRRTGVRVTRVPARCRGFRGETFLWITRRKSLAATGESLPARFDALVAATTD